MSETCEACGATAMPPRGWTNWTCSECGHTQGDEIETTPEAGA